MRFYGILGEAGSVRHRELSCGTVAGFVLQSSYRHERTGKCVRARYVATREEMATRYAEWEITGDVELRSNDPVQMFNPALPLLVQGNQPDVSPDMQPAIDACERFLARVLLRRYVTWCARARRFDRAGGAAALYRRLA